MNKQKGLDIIGLVPSANRTDARNAFRRLAKSFHPDKFPKNPLKATIAEEKMKQINEAFHFGSCRISGFFKTYLTQLFEFI